MDKVACTSLSDFVTDNKALHQQDPERYEYDVALMLLQLCNAVHHLESNHIALQTINLKQIFLVKTNLPTSDRKPVLNHLFSELDESEEPEGRSEVNLGVMTYEMLHLPNPFVAGSYLTTRPCSASALPSIPNKSKYSRCLNHLATQFLTTNSSSRLTANQAALALQTMLWGPQVEQLPLDTKDPKALEQALQQWLLLEQARVVNKAAESSVGHQGTKTSDSTFGLRDLLQCQYLSKATVNSLKEGLKLLYFAKN